MNKIKTIACPPLEGNRSAFTKDQIRAWLISEPFQKLTRHFNGDIDFDAETPSLIDSLLAFSSAWDYRGQLLMESGKSASEGMRWLLDDSTFSPEELKLILNCARQLGLVIPQKPPLKKYDYILSLGGARLSCLLRTRLAAELIYNKTIEPSTVVLLGSGRTVTDSERDATDTYAPNAVSEFDLMNAGAAKVFDLDEANFSEEQHNDINPNQSWVVRHYQSGNNNQQLKIISLSAPSSEPESRRANSADTYDFFIDRMHVKAGCNLLLITSQIYVPYQQLEAIRRVALPKNVVLDTIGWPPEWGGALQGMQSTKNYLQEIRSVVQASKRFLDEYPTEQM
ncbi:MAG: hypothetical protein ACYC6B_02650 [Thermoleophilia bacterium]